MLRLLKNKRLLLKWSVSYLALLCLTIIVNLVAYSIVERNIVSQNNRNAVEVLRHQKQTMDDLKSRLINIAYGISLNENVRSLALKADKIDAENRIEFFNLMGKVKGYFGMDKYTDNIMIYFNNLDYIIASNSNNYSGVYYDVYYSEKNMTKNEWFSVITQNHSGDFVDFSSKGEEKGKGNLLFLYSIYGNERFRPRATIALEIPYSEFFAGDTLDHPGRTFLAVDKNQNIILSDINGDISFAEDFLNNNELLEGINDYGDFVTVVMPSDVDDCSYVNIITKKEFRKKVNESRLIMIVCNILCIGVLGWLALMLSSSNYKPLQNIIDTLKAGDKDINVGEFQFINSKINEMMVESSYIKQKKQKQDKLLKDAMLVKLLKNNPLPKNKDEIFEELEIIFPYNNFICVLFCIEMNSDMFFDNDNNDSNADYELSKVVISNITDELLDSGSLRYYCDTDNMLGMIVNISEKSGSSELYRTLEQVHDFVRKHFNIRFTAGISSVYEKRENIHLCYEEAKSCVDYRFFEQRKIIKFEDTAKMSADVYYYPHALEERLIGMIRIGDVENCVGLLDEIFEKNTGNRELSVNQAKNFLKEIISTMQKKAAGDETVSELLRLSELIENNEISFNAAKEKIYKIIVNICRNSEGDKNLRINETMERVKNYVNDNYSDPDLNVNTIAGKFNITPSYMSTVFKKYTQMGLQEYITSIRIEHAKNILSITDYTIDKVSVIVGYVNSRSFSRAFSKYVGVSPGKYKEQNGEREEDI